MAESMVKTFQVQPTIFFQQRGPELCRVFSARIAASGELGRCRIEMEANGRTCSSELGPVGIGENAYTFALPDVSSPTRARFTLRAPGEEVRCETDVAPQRKWIIFTAPSIHTDLYYNNVAPVVERIHAANIDRVLDICRETEEWPEGERLAWNCECVWQIENYMRRRPERSMLDSQVGAAAPVRNRIDELFERIREGRIEVGAFYAHPLTEVFGDEELVRMLYPAARLRRERGLAIDSVVATDTCGYTWSIPSILAGSGIRYMSAGINNCWGPFHANTDLPPLFRWLGPDGRGVLLWQVTDYGHWQQFRLHQSIEAFAEELPKLMCRVFGRADSPVDYPGDAMLLHGAFGDNIAIDDGAWPAARQATGVLARDVGSTNRRGSATLARGATPSVRAILERIREWNRRWAYPRLVVATNREFFQHAEAHWGDQIPALRGDLQSYWSYGSASAARETAVIRRVHEELPAAEALACVAEWVTSRGDAETPSKEDILPAHHAYQEMIFADPHGQGRDFSAVAMLQWRNPGYPAEELDDAYNRAVLFDDAAWGSDYSVVEPEAPKARAIRAAKEAWLYEAASLTHVVARRSLANLTARVAAEGTNLLVVWNLLPWERTDVVYAEVPRAFLGNATPSTGSGQASLEVVEAESGAVLAAQLLQDAPVTAADNVAVCFIARLVPALGYRTYYVRRSAVSPQPTGRVPDRQADSAPARQRPLGSRASTEWFALRGDQAETPFFRVQIDPETGGLASLVDLTTGHELADAQGPYRLNQFIYDRGYPEGYFNVESPISIPGRHPAFQRETPGGVEVALVEVGPVFARIRATSSMPAARQATGALPRAEALPHRRGSAAVAPGATPSDLAHLAQDVILYADIARVDLVNRVEKREVWEEEAGYFAFPFDLSPPRVRCSIPNATLVPEAEQLSGACRELFAIQTWVDLAAGGRGVTLASREAAIVEFGDILTGAWLKRLEISRGHVFSLVFNNYWWTNYPASQGGSMTFAYSLWPHGGDRTVGDAERFGDGFACPLQAIFVPKPLGAADRPHLPPSSGFAIVEPENVRIQAIKRADDGRGWIVRLRELEGRAAEAELRLGPFRISQAVGTDLVEEDLEPLPVAHGAVRIPVDACGFATVRLWLL